ncbi:hypothetical protein Zmor_019904 [Zophobas morio]|uniref:Uncharacterized protein n=1 Tax=Zophobas morio TaxID=2755281 RepID=A0AA38M9A7_9CUCU|nr:hypothetical protein Zmor_019904 [Zophobas morio]
MKFLPCLVFVALIVTAQSLTDEQKTIWRKWSQECQAETGVSTDAINKVANNDFSAVDDKMKAQSLCYGKKAGLIDASGDIDVEKVKTKLRNVVDNEDQVNEIIGKCVVNKGTKEETSLHVFKCIRENQPKFTPI